MGSSHQVYDQYFDIEKREELKAALKNDSHPFKSEPLQKVFQVTLADWEFFITSSCKCQCLDFCLAGFCLLSGNGY